MQSLAKTLLFFGVAQQFLKGVQNISVGLLRGPGVWIGLCAGFGATGVLILRRFQKDLRLDEPTSLSRS